MMSNTILVIDDNIDLLNNINRLLELSGYKTYTACNGLEGIELARKHKPELILCDIIMPELDGYGVLRALENIPEMAQIPFIFLTGKAEITDFRKGMDLGAEDYIPKPFSGSDLLKIVSTRLKKSNLLKKNIEENVEINNYNNEIKLLDINTLFEQRIIKKIKAKDNLFMEGDSANFLYFVISGKIKKYKTNEFGKEFITEIYKGGDFLGYIALFDGGMQKESAMAIENSEIAIIPKEDFLKLLSRNSELAVKFIRFMAISLSENKERLLKLAYGSARKRMAEALLFVHKKYYVEGKNVFSFNLLRENISAIAGISPESVSRNLTNFRDEGLIKTENGEIKIIDFKKLESIKN